LSATGAAFVRLGGAAVILLVILAVVRPGVMAAVRADGGALVLYGLLAMAGVQVAFFNALLYLPVTVALLLEYTGPVFVILWVWLVRGQPPGPRTVLGAAVALLGLTLVVQVWSGIGLRWEGLAWGFAAALCQAAYFLLADRAGNETPPLVLAGVGMIAYLTGVAAIARIGASRGALVALLEVVASAVASWLLLGQVPTAVQALGGVLILTGVAFTNTARPVAFVEPEPRLP
jgi:drug/metabolite transporter (DMT)-like permease